MADPDLQCSKCKQSILHPNLKTINNNYNNNNNIIIKCNGDECKKKFHLSCILNKIPINSKLYSNLLKQDEQKQNTSTTSLSPIPSSLSNYLYVCDNCDVEGSSRYLMEYFEDFLCKKQQYYSDYIKTKSATKTTTSSTNTTIDNGNDDSMSSSFITFLFQQTEHLCKMNSNKPSEINFNFIQNIYKKSNESREKYNKISSNKTRRRSTLSTLSSSSDMHNITTNSDDDDDDEMRDIDESILIGKPIKLYNPIDNTYHIGRIVDWRKNKMSSLSNESPTSPSAKLLYPVIPSDFISIEYLIRFREGLNSRKAAVHQWITLEEHAISIGLHIIWATPSNTIMTSTTNSTTATASSNCNNNKTEQKQQLKQQLKQNLIIPGQIMLRSALEMIPIKRSLLLQNHKYKFVNNTSTLVYCNFFNMSQHSIISILDQSIPFDFETLSSSMENNTFWNNNNMNTTTTTTKKNNSKEDNNNSSSISNNNGDIDENGIITITIANACIEYEEQRRIRLWHKLSMFGFTSSTNNDVDVVINATKGGGEEKNSEVKMKDVVNEENQQQRHLPDSITLNHTSSGNNDTTFYV